MGNGCWDVQGYAYDIYRPDSGSKLSLLLCLLAAKPYTAEKWPVPDFRAAQISSYPRVALFKPDIAVVCSGTVTLWESLLQEKLHCHHVLEVESENAGQHKSGRKKRTSQPTLRPFSAFGDNA